MLYFVSVALYAAAMFAVYLLFLRNSTHFQLARHYLLANALLPFVLPLISLPASVGERAGKLATISLPEVGIGTVMQSYAPSVNYSQVVTWTYMAVAACLLLRCFAQLFFIRRVIRRQKAIRHGDVFIVENTGYGPGSFGRYIFLPGEQVNEMILAHERAHVGLHHTRDIVLMSLLQAIAWPNLLLIFIRKELENVHEFQADEIPGANRRDYLELLVSAAFTAHCAPLMHSFIVHPIKRRMMMLQKNRTSVLKPVLQVSVSLLLLLPAMLAVQSCSKQEKNSSAMQAGIGGKEVKGDLTYKTAQGNDTTVKFGFFTEVDVMPEFPGGTQGLMDFLARTVKYPEVAREKNIQGKVIVRFAVTDEGKVLDPEVVRSPDASLSAAALDAIKQMPKWKPGIKDGEPVCVAYTLPVSFRLDN